VCVFDGKQYIYILLINTGAGGGGCSGVARGWPAAEGGSRAHTYGGGVYTYTQF